MCKKMGRVLGTFTIGSQPNQKTYKTGGGKRNDSAGERGYSSGNTMVPKQGWLEWYIEQNTEVDDYDQYQQ